MHTWIYRGTFVLLVVAWGLAVIWFISKPDYEPALTTAALLASITGIFAERWFTTQERRRQFITLLAQEIQFNQLVADSESFRAEFSPQRLFYPRFLTDAADSLISSGEFASPADRGFVCHLRRHRRVITQVNRKIGAIELKLFLLTRDAEVKQQYHKALTDLDGPIVEAKESLQDFHQRLIAMPGIEIDPVCM